MIYMYLFIYFIFHTIALYSQGGILYFIYDQKKKKFIRVLNFKSSHIMYFSLLTLFFVNTLLCTSQRPMGDTMSIKITITITII